MKKALTIVGLTLLTSLSAQTAYADNATDISIKEPYAREVPPGAPASASFMALTNKSTETINLVGAASDVAQKVELHTHTHDKGVMRMRMVEKISIPAKGVTTLKPGGYHIMLIGLKDPLKEGQKIDVTLKFADGSTAPVSMPVHSVKTIKQKQAAQNSECEQ